MTKNKINILQVVAGMNRGGAETFLMNVLRTIDRDKYHFVFLCYGEKPFDYEEEILALGGELVRIPEVGKSGILNHIHNLRKVIKNKKIDVIHAHTYFNSVFSLFAGKLEGIRVRIVHSHNTKSEENPSLLKRIYFFISKKAIARYATVYLACGDSAGRALFGRIDFEIIKNGIRIDEFKFNRQVRRDLRVESGLGEKDNVLMHIGRFEEQKNHTFLLDVFSEYTKLRPSSKLVLIGDGPLRSSIESKVQKLQLTDSVTFLGVRSDVSNLYNIADIFIFPSLFEGLPVVLVEAQANGLVSMVSSSVDMNAKITNTMNFMDLSMGPDEWAREMNSLNSKRIDTTTEMNDSGYAIEHVVGDLTRVYRGFES